MREKPAFSLLNGRWNFDTICVPIYSSQYFTAKQIGSAQGTITSSVTSQGATMYVSKQTILDIEVKYGKPEALHIRQPMIDAEFDLLIRSMKHNRAHDITLFIFVGSDIVAISKHMHPEGVCRAPSGGLKPGEDFEEGALREAYEETGAVVALEKYILRVHAVFTYDGQEVPWTSHVFTAKYVSGELCPIDTVEIAKVRLVSLDELQGPVRDKLLASGSGGLAYRAALTDKVVELLETGAALRPLEN